jgi:hypothetical protein
MTTVNTLNTSPEGLITLILQKYNADDINASNLPNIIGYTMILVSNLKTLTGLQKKDLVMRTITTLITDNKDMSIDSKQILLILAPNLIDYLVKVDKGEIKINTGVSQDITNCFGSCLGR